MLPLCLGGFPLAHSGGTIEAAGLDLHLTYENPLYNCETTIKSFFFDPHFCPLVVKTLFGAA